MFFLGGNPQKYIFNYEMREMTRKKDKMQGLATKEHKKAQKREARRILTG